MVEERATFKMVDTSSPRPFGSTYCKQYKTNAEFFIADCHTSGERHLIVRYQDGGFRGDKGDFLAAIPKDWTDADVQVLVLWPMADPNSPYPAWEVPARMYGSDYLFRWWRSERPS